MRKALVSALWTCIAVLALAGTVPDNALRLRPSAQALAVGLMPEGWNFFTRDATEPQLLVYGRQGREWSSRGMSNIAISGGLGVLKNARLLDLQAVYLTQVVPESLWTRCVLRTSACADQLRSKVVSIRSRAVVPRLCGELLLEKRPLVRWGWRRARRRVTMPADVVRLNVTCSGNGE